MLHGKNIDIEDSQLSDFIQNIKDISDQCKDLLKKCLKINPLDRITATQMIDHPWVMAKRPVGVETVIEINEEDERQAISKINKDILREITRIHLKELKS